MIVPDVAFVVLAHQAPDQVGRLLRRLSSPRTAAFVHVDASAPDEVVDRIGATTTDADVTFLSRRRTPWASWGLVAAVLDGLRAALDSPRPPHHVVVTSGQDYPLRPVEGIADFLAEHPGTSFLGHFPVPNRLYARGGLERVRYWHRPVRRRRVFIPVPRRYPSGLVPRGGAQFCVLTRDAARAVLDHGRDRPDVLRFHRHVWIPDEHYIPTVLWDVVDRASIPSENLWHLRYSPGAASPHVFGPADFDELHHAALHSSEVGGRSRAKLFARKVDQRDGAALLDRIDRELLLADPTS